MNSVDDERNPQELYDQDLVRRGMPLTQFLPHGKKTREQAEDRLDRLVRDPRFRAEHRRLLDLYGAPEPWPYRPIAMAPTPGHELRRFGPYPPPPPSPTLAEVEAFWSQPACDDPETYEGWKARRSEWTRNVQDACRAFAARQQFEFTSPAVVAWALASALGGSCALEDVPKELAPEYAGQVPILYFNPTTDQELTLTIRPGEIVALVPHASTENLRNLAPTLSALQNKLGYKKHGGGPRREDRGERCQGFRRELGNAVYLARHQRAELGDAPRGDLRQHEVAFMLGCSVDTLRNRIAECGGAWAEVRRLRGSRTRDNRSPQT